MLKFNPSKRVVKFLEKLKGSQHKHARQLAEKIQMLLQSDGQTHDTEDLKGMSPFRRTDQGEYRIIFHVEEDILYVDEIGKRNDDEVYKRMRRLL